MEKVYGRNLTWNWVSMHFFIDRRSLVELASNFNVPFEIEWKSDLVSDEIFLSSICLPEIVYSHEKLPNSSKYTFIFVNALNAPVSRSIDNNNNNKLVPSHILIWGFESPRAIPIIPELKWFWPFYCFHFFCLSFGYDLETNLWYQTGSKPCLEHFLCLSYLFVNRSSTWAISNKWTTIIDWNKYRMRIIQT